MTAFDCRLYQPGSKTKEKNERPAPTVQTTPRMTERINSGTHLLGLLSNANILRSHDSLPDANDLMQSVGSDAFRAGDSISAVSQLHDSSSHEEGKAKQCHSSHLKPRFPRAILPLMEWGSHGTAISAVQHLVQHGTNICTPMMKGFLHPTHLDERQDSATESNASRLSLQRWAARQAPPRHFCILQARTC